MRCTPTKRSELFQELKEGIQRACPPQMRVLTLYTNGGTIASNEARHRVVDDFRRNGGVLLLNAAEEGIHAGLDLGMEALISVGRLRDPGLTFLRHCLRASPSRGPRTSVFVVRLLKEEECAC